jgi:hypothetical protein
MAFADVGFVSDYTVWIHHGETMVGDDDNNDQGLDTETLKLLHQYDNEEDMFYDCGGNEQGGDFSNEQHANDGGGAAPDGGAREGDEDDIDNLEHMILAFAPEVLLQKKGLENLEKVKTASKETVYGVEKGCPTH